MDPTRRKRGLQTVIAASVLAWTLLPAAAQAPAPAPSATPTGVLADPAFQAAQKRYDALPDAERRAIQEALMWTGDFAGAGSGTYGPLTFRAIQAFQKRAGAPADGFLAPKERTALEAAATKARTDVRFARLQDGKAGLQIGVPQMLLSKVTPSRLGTRYAAPDGSAALETFAQQGTDLPTLFAQLTADQPGRKITYKVLRPDFFVFTADQDGRRSYTRFAPGPGGGLKGFVFTYPVAAAPTLDRVSVAIANSFDPAAAPPAGSAGASAAVAPSGVAGPAAPTLPAGVQPGQPFAVGLVIGAGKVLTSASVASCTELLVTGRTARVERADKGNGVATLDVAGLPAAGATPVLGEPPADGAAVLVAGFAPGPGSDAALSVGPGDIRIPTGSGQFRLVAPLQTGGAGTPVFDRRGALVGVVTAVPQEPRLVAGIVPAASYPMVGPDGLTGVGLARAAATGSDVGLGDLAGRTRGLVVGITCRR